MMIIQNMKELEDWIKKLEMYEPQKDDIEDITY